MDNYKWLIYNYLITMLFPSLKGYFWSAFWGAIPMLDSKTI